MRYYQQRINELDNLVDAIPSLKYLDEGTQNQVLEAVEAERAEILQNVELNQLAAESDDGYPTTTLLQDSANNVYPS